MNSRIALGCVTFGREIDENQSFRILDYAFERGVRLLDTAEAYGGGASERVIGQWLQATGLRKQVSIQTKVSFQFTAAGVRDALAGSLDRLRTDFLDYYLLHRVDDSTGVVECVQEMLRGPVKAVGCSNASAVCLRRSVELLQKAGLPSFAVVQPAYNLLQREIERDLLPFCVRQGIDVVPYSPLAAGFLTGKYTPDRSAVPANTRFAVIPGHMAVYFSDRNFRIVNQLHRFAEFVGVPPLRLAIAWVLHTSAIKAVLTGARNVKHIKNALEAAKMDVPAAWIAEMDSWGEPG